MLSVQHKTAVNSLTESLEAEANKTRPKIVRNIAATEVSEAARTSLRPPFYFSYWKKRFKKWTTIDTVDIFWLPQDHESDWSAPLAYNRLHKDKTEHRFLSRALKINEILRSCY